MSKSRIQSKQNFVLTRMGEKPAKFSSADSSLITSTGSLPDTYFINFDN